MTDAGGSTKLPKNYKLVFDVVRNQPVGVHAAAGDIYAAAKQLRAGIGYSTVYRALERLRDLGLVHEVRVPGASSSLYEPARASHAHFHCEHCGCVEDIDYRLPAGEVDQIAHVHKIAVSQVELTFNGLCHTCRLLHHAGESA